MKDITVALELTVPTDMPDGSVKELVEGAISSALAMASTNFEVDRNLIEVVAVCDDTGRIGGGSYTPPAEEKWRIT